MIRIIKTKLDLRAVFLFLLYCDLTPTAFGSDQGRLDMEPPGGAPHLTQMNTQAGSSKENRELDQSTVMPEPEHVMNFRKGVNSICTKYLDSLKEIDVIETWNVFFTLLERNKLLSKEEITKILNELPEESQYEQDSKDRLKDWYREYVQNLAITPDFSLSSKAIKRRFSAALTPLRPSL